MARELLEAGRLLLAMNSFARAFDKCNLAPANPSVRAVALSCMAEAALGLKRYDEAIHLVNRALKEKDPRHRDLLLLLGRAYRESNRCRHARPYYRARSLSSRGSHRAGAGRHSAGTPVDDG